METTQKLYAIEWRINQHQSWRLDDMRFRTSREELEVIASNWWGPGGHGYQYRIIEFVRKEPSDA